MTLTIPDSELLGGYLVSVSVLDLKSLERRLWLEVTPLYLMPLEWFELRQRGEEQIMANQAQKVLSHTLEECLKNYPWLWAVTNRWFFGKDDVCLRFLSAPLLQQLVYSKITDGGSRGSWYVYQRLKDGVEQVEGVGRYSTRGGTPMARVIRNYLGVQFLIRLKWVGSGKQMHREITLYDVPQGPRGSKLGSLCAKALKTCGDGLDDKKPYSQKRVNVVTKACVQALRPQHR
ncbi:MAG: hypothetical protein NUV85_01920 [Candidatus Berkelbacteria bacterium]|nr:hypothetical protein [Candidatus Berkelbacteria bacterium]